VASHNEPPLKIITSLSLVEIQTEQQPMMSAKEAQQYDNRAVRISELCGLHGKFRSDLGKKADSANK